VAQSRRSNPVNKVVGFADTLLHPSSFFLHPSSFIHKVKMLKAKIILTVVKYALWVALIGVGVWFLSSSIGGNSITYTSLESFLRAIGACSGDDCNVASVNGCFLCPYIEKLFYTIGVAALAFWNAIIKYIWVLLAIGFAIFLFYQTFKHIQEQNKENSEMSDKDRDFDFKKWFDPVWKKALRILVVGAIIGVGGYGGATTLRIVTNVTIMPVMYVGSQLAMAATGVNDSSTCGSGTISEDDENNIMGPALQPFMCVVGNLNTMILAGAAGGFSLMNYAYLDLGGGTWTWISGLALVIMFLIIGFNIFFKILSVVFQLLFLIIFLPLIIAAWAFEEWKIFSGFLPNAISMLAKCAIRVIAITLQILVMYAIVLFAADEYFPGPRDNYSAILPPGIAFNMQTNANLPQISVENASVMEVFANCEKIGTDNGAHDMDKDKFKACWDIERARVEQVYPGAFDFMDNGWEFFLLMLGLFLVYFYVISKKIDDLLGGTDQLGVGNDPFEFGKYVQDFGKTLWAGPQKLLGAIGKSLGVK
jgi:large-conductance mechanosensitive channel